jgi:hypothetical protein
MKPAHRGLASVLLAGLLVLAGCAGGGSRTPTDEPSGAGSDSATPADSAAPSVDGSASPTSPGTATPTGSPTPGSTPVGTAGATPGGTSPSATVAPSSCPTVNPTRVSRAETGPRRATEVVTVISDGNNLTSGTREQADFVTPALTAPDGTTITDEATFRKIATLVAGQRHRVLLTRPEPPDTTASAGRKPFNSPGTYVVYNASSQLVADVVVQCSGAELIWTFVSEADPSSGQVNCAVEPPRTNALARILFQNNC